jgi:LysR family glycine cleavage system transcriptional activator
VLADFISDGIDIAIRYGGGNDQGVASEFLFDEIAADQKDARKGR